MPNMASTSARQLSAADLVQNQLTGP